ncbi:MAG: O-antigen ligase family protein [Phycisphaerales bacterium]|nr:O-antigen ligase family protein [Phycisphaerales bacterium]
MEILFGLLLSLKMSGAWLLLTTAVGLPIAAGTVSTLICCLLYLLMRARSVFALFTRQLVVAWTLFLMAAIIIGAAVAGPHSISGVGRFLTLLMLYLATFVWGSRVSPSVARATFFLAAGLVLVALAVDYQSSFISDTVSAVSGKNYESGGRLSGFYLQPNMAASQLILLFVAWGLLARRTFWWTVIASVSLLLLVASTGSRAGVAVAALVAMLAVLTQQSGLASRAVMRLMQAARAAALLMAILALIAAAQFMPLSSQSSDKTGESIKRALSVVQFDRSLQSQEQDRSVSRRVEAARGYLDRIEQRPWFGHGMGASEVLQREERVRAPHNEYLHLAYEFGIPVTGVWVVLFLVLLANRHRSKMEWEIGSNVVWQFVLAVLILGFASNSIGTLRPTWIVLALICAALYKGPIFARRRTGFLIADRPCSLESEALVSGMPTETRWGGLN